VVSSDWASNEQENNIVEMLVMPFLRHKLAAAEISTSFGPYHFNDHISNNSILDPPFCMQNCTFQLPCQEMGL